MPNNPFVSTSRSACETDLDPSGAAGLPLLTRREREVLRHTARGLSNAELAEELTVAVGTVKCHLHRIYHKLGVSHRAHAVAIAYCARDVDLDDPTTGRRATKP